MAITSSAKKAHRQSEKRRIKNIQKSRKLKDVVKEVRVLVAEKKIQEAKKLLSQAYQILDKSAKVGLIKKNNASRKKSRLTKLVNKAQKS